MKYSTPCIQHTYNTPLKYNQNLHYNSVIRIFYLIHIIVVVFFLGWSWRLNLFLHLLHCTMRTIRKRLPGNRFLEGDTVLYCRGVRGWKRTHYCIFRREGGEGKRLLYYRRGMRLEEIKIKNFFRVIEMFCLYFNINITEQFPKIHDALIMKC